MAKSKKNPVDPLSFAQRLGYLIYDVSHLFRVEFNDLMQGSKITQGLWRVLVHLQRMEGCQQKELASLLEITPISLGRLIDRLEEEGLVRRKADPGDRRSSKLFLTEEGMASIHQIKVYSAEFLKSILIDMSKTEQNELLISLEKMRTRLAERRRSPPLPL